ncbi:MAG: hypothetical protein KGQ66_02705 [Acidobacteriota bacterium]|nr:hypothetical protein [Acidobacteriota bacterium]
MARHLNTSSMARHWAVPALLTVALLGPACSSSSPTSAPPPSATAAPTTTPGPTTAPGGATSLPGPASSTTSGNSTVLSSVLNASYQAETGALATYRNVVSALGSVGPFPNVIVAEEQHVATVTGLLTRHGLPVPASSAGQAAPSTLRAACGLGVAVEQQVISLYSAQIPEVSAYPDVTTALQNLQSVSRDNHLPAFERCA